MRQVTVSSTRSYSSTRSSIKKPIKNTKFTASDFEIFSDLNKLDPAPQLCVSKKRIFKKISENLPQKRQRTTKSIKNPKQITENEVISALVCLIQKENEAKDSHFDNKLNEKKFNCNEVQSNININEVGYQNKNENEPVLHENCINSILIPSNIFSVQIQTEKMKVQMEVV